MPSVSESSSKVADAASPRATKGSERALDATAFFLADTSDGLGPFLIIDLTSRRHWSAADAGLSMSMLLLGTVLSQTWTGAWIDRTHHKTRAVSCAAVTVAVASILLYSLHSRLWIYAAQFLTGCAVTVFAPALAAISLGLVGRRRLPARAGRNEACFHAGNVVAAVVAIVANSLWGSRGIFGGVALMAVASAVSAQLIRQRDINHDLARGADSANASSRVVPWTVLLQDRRLWWLTLAVVLFHFANAAMLPLVGQKVGHRDPSQAQNLMALCIIVAQIAMVPVAMITSRTAAIRRRPTFLVAFAILPLRGWLYTQTDSSLALIAIQLLDAIGAGIFGVVVILMIADLTRGTGRFNFTQGVIFTAIGLGAAASNYLTGLVVDSWGYNAGFLSLAAIAVVALLTFFFTVEETGPVFEAA